MAGPESPSTETFTEAPAQGSNKIMDLIRKYWYVALALAIIVVFLLYHFIRNSSAQTGAQSTTASTPVSPTQPDQQNVIDMLSTQYQDLLNRMSGWAAYEGQAGASSTVTNTGPGGPANQSAPAPPVARDAANQSAPAPPVSRDAASQSAPANSFPGGVVPNPSITNRWRLAGAVGGVPPSGRTVPFGTHVGMHDPLVSSGSMYADERGVA